MKKRFAEFDSFNIDYDLRFRKPSKSPMPSAAVSRKPSTAKARASFMDGAQAIAEITGSAITATYLTGLQIDEVLARYAGSGNKTLLTDDLGSVIAQANDQQGIQNFYAYTPYGEVQPLGPDDNNPIQYTARENDQTGLYFYRARYYDPVLKRFISEDPIGLQGGLNPYAYVGGNPILLADPLGLIPICLPGMRCFSDQLPPTDKIPPKEPQSPGKPKQKIQGEECAKQPILEECEMCCTFRNRFNPNNITPCIINYCTDPRGITKNDPPQMCIATQ